MAPAAERPATTPSGPAALAANDVAPVPGVDSHSSAEPEAPSEAAPHPVAPTAGAGAREARVRRASTASGATPASSVSPPAPRPVVPQPAPATASERGATGPQLRRFIKSRAYVPVHELRRRFGLNGADDEVTAVEVDQRRVFVGLPAREGQLLGELLRGGDIGAELSLDPIAPIVVGVYPIRPIPRS